MYLRYNSAFGFPGLSLTTSNAWIKCTDENGEEYMLLSPERAGVLPPVPGYFDLIQTIEGFNFSLLEASEHVVCCF